MTAREAGWLALLLVGCAVHGVVQRLRGQPVAYWMPSRGARRG